MAAKTSLAEDLAKSLSITTDLMQILLGEIRDNAATMAVMKEKVDSLSDKIQVINIAVGEFNDQKTKLALLENHFDNIKDQLAAHMVREEATGEKTKNAIESIKTSIGNNKKVEEKNKTTKFLGVLKLVGVMITAAGTALVALWAGK